MPANTQACIPASAFPSTGGNITVGDNKGFRVNDPVSLSYPVGATVTNAIAAGDYFVKTYSPSTGIMTLSSTIGGAAATATAAPSGFGTAAAEIAFRSWQPVAEAAEWTFDVTVNEVDTSTIGQNTGQYLPMRRYTTTYGDATGTATVHFTDDDNDIANRMVTDVFQRRQSGAKVKLYIDTVYVNGVVNDGLSRSIEMPIVLTSANFRANTNDAQQIQMNFRPAGNVDFDFLKT